MNWFDATEAFKAVATENSFAGGARLLGIANSVITKRIQWLEHQLKTDLFIRTTRKVTLTETGKQFFQRIDPLLNEWHDIQTEALDYQSALRGELKLCLPTNMSGLASINKIIKRFIDKHPQIKMNIRNTHKPTSLMESDIDILIATDKYVLDPDITIAKPLFRLAYQCFASPAYLKKFSEPQKPADLKQHNCLIFKNDQSWQLGKQVIPVSGNFRGASGDALIGACREGLGICYMPAFMIADELKKKTVRRILNQYESSGHLLSAFYLKREYKPRKVLAFLELLEKEKHNIKA